MMDQPPSWVEMLARNLDSWEDDGQDFFRATVSEGQRDRKDVILVVDEDGIAVFDVTLQNESSFHSFAYFKTYQASAKRQQFSFVQIRKGTQSVHEFRVKESKKLHEVCAEHIKNFVAEILARKRSKEGGRSPRPRPGEVPRIAPPPRARSTVDRRVLSSPPACGPGALPSLPTSHASFAATAVLPSSATYRGKKSPLGATVDAETLVPAVKSPARGDGLRKRNALSQTLPLEAFFASGSPPEAVSSDAATSPMMRGADVAHFRHSVDHAEDDPGDTVALLHSISVGSLSASNADLSSMRASLRRSESWDDMYDHARS